MKTLEFNGNASEYFKIWIVNILLVIVTIGLYYPWAKVRNKRYFYANTLLDGRNFEYHATGGQLFYGYLIAMILLILYMVIQETSPIGSLVLLGILFLAIPWIILKSMIFNMKMTSFSNVYFSFGGDIKQSYINFFAYPLALYISIFAIFMSMSYTKSIDGAIGIILTIALLVIMIGFIIYALAYIKKKNTHYFLDNTKYAQGSFKTNLDIKKLAIILSKTLGVAVLSLVAIFIVAGLVTYLTVGIEVIAGLSQLGQNPTGENPDELESRTITLIMLLLPMIMAIYICMIFAMIFIMAYSLTRHRTYIYENTTLDEKINFSSTLAVLPYARMLISNFIVIILTLGFAIPWAKVRVARLMLKNTHVKAEAGFDEYISRNQPVTSSLGEQIGDAFDVDVGIGI